MYDHYDDFGSPVILCDSTFKYLAKPFATIVNFLSHDRSGSDKSLLSLAGELEHERRIVIEQNDYRYIYIDSLLAKVTLQESKSHV